MKLSKRAGLLKVPEQTVKEMWRWLKSQYAARVLPEVLEEYKHPFVTKEVEEKLKPKVKEMLQKAREMVKDYGAHNFKTVVDEENFIKELSAPYIVMDRYLFTYQKAELVITCSPYVDEMAPAGQGWWIVSLSRNIVPPKGQPEQVPEFHNLTLIQAINVFILKMEETIDNLETYHVDETEIVDSKLTINTIKKDAAKEISMFKEFSVVESDVEYSKNRNSPWPHRWRVKVQILDENKMNPEGDNSVASYAPGLISIAIPHDMLEIDDLTDYREKLYSLKISLIHEIRHLVQDIMDRLNNLRNYDFGLPPKKVRDWSVQPTGETKDSVDSMRINHPLRDVEFHTRLGEEVAAFSKYVSEYDRKYLPLLIRRWTDVQVEPVDEKSKSILMRLSPSHFFKQLHWYQPNKWKIAVKEFIKAVS